MSAHPVRIAIDVSFEGEQISGEAGDGIGPPQPFSGWLGLITVLDRLLAPRRRPPEPEDDPSRASDRGAGPR
jgi:hypothetical protein